MPRKQRMVGRLGASESESSIQNFLTLENLVKERRGIRSSWSFPRKPAISRLLERLKHANNHGEEAMPKKAHTVSERLGKIIRLVSSDLPIITCAE